MDSSARICPWLITKELSSAKGCYRIICEMGKVL